MANTPSKRPTNPPTVSAPPVVAAPPAKPAKPASKPNTGRMMTPPPAARKSSGQIPVHGSPGGTTPPPPPARGGTAGPQGATAGGPQQRRPVMAAKPQGMPIKMKVVASMSGLAVGIVVIIFVIVLNLGKSSLEATIEESGRANLQQAEVSYNNYYSTLSESGMIAYFSQGNNRPKFDSYWKGLHGEWPAMPRSGGVKYPWFNNKIPGCRQFANYQQLTNDRIWVMVASELKAGVAAKIMENPANANGPADILGAQAWADIQRLPSLPEPTTPRVVNAEAMRRFNDWFGDLRAAYKVNQPTKSWDDLRTEIAKETDANLISHPQGLRRLIFTKYRDEFVGQIDALTGAENTQVRLVIFELKPTDRMSGFSAGDLSITSPSKVTTKLEVKDSNFKRTDRGMDIDPHAGVDGEPAFSFAREQQGSGDRVAIYLDRKYIDSRQASLVMWLSIVAAVAILVSIGTAFFIGSNITGPLQLLMTDIQIISGGNFDHKPMARSRDEIGIVSRLLGDMAAGLKQAQEVWAENQSRKHDLDIAKEIQENLLPKHVPRIAGYDVSAYYSPSKEVGGDYYDFFLVDKTHLGMICADVSGKGIPGSMVMMMTKALVSYEAESNLSPRDIFCKVNRTLAKDIKRGMFVTAFYMLLDIPTARLTVASAGHNPLLMYRASTKQCVEINPGGIALGFDKDGRLFERNMKEETIQLQRGDRVVIYTDGVTEAMSPDGQEFSSERLISITTQAANAPSSQYLTTLVNALQSHAQSDDQHDDITIVTVKVG